MDGTARVEARIGDVLVDQYRVEGLLGKGGMGLVYAVVDIQTGTPLAMKVLTNTADPEHVTRFSREARATMRLDSAHVVRVIDVGSMGGTQNKPQPFMVMERLEGSTLKAMVERFTRLDERTVADLAIQACEGLAHAHANGIVHRDVKPSNLFVMREHQHLKVLDFGISRASALSLEDWEKTATVTESHALLGSPNYVSPEQLKSPSNVDERADIWSLGVSMYYALSGKYPFRAASLAELLVAVMSQEPTPIVKECAATTPRMSAILSRCLDRSLERRYRHVSDLANDLAALASPSRAAHASRVTSILARAPSLIRPSTPPHPLATSATTGETTMTVDGVMDKAHALPHEILPTIEPEPTFSQLQPRAPIAAPTKKRPSWILGVAIASVTAMLIAGIGIAVVARSSKTIAAAATSAEPSFPPPPTPTPTPEAPTSSASSSAILLADPAAPQLQLIADAPITKVIKPASKRVALEDGKAIVTVNPYSVDLAIEVEIAGGGHARGVAKAGGATTIHLITTTKSGKPIGKIPVGGRGGSAATTTTSSSELHKSPYEE